jgi:hypothetical protein
MSDYGRLPLPLPAVPNEKNTIAAANAGKRNNFLFTVWVNGVIFQRFSNMVPFYVYCFHSVGFMVNHIVNFYAISNSKLMDLTVSHFIKIGTKTHGYCYQMPFDGLSGSWHILCWSYLRE